MKRIRDSFAMATLIAVCLLSATAFGRDSWYEKSHRVIPGGWDQGIATDGAFWYFSATRGLIKTDLDLRVIIDRQKNALPDSLRQQGYDHIGDLVYFEGRLYAPLEESRFVKPAIAIFDTSSLTFTGEIFRVRQSHFPWLAVHPDTRLFYATEFDPVDSLFVYDRDQDFARVNAIKLDRTLRHAQGGTFYQGTLYVACDDGPDDIFTIDPATGKVDTAFQLASGYEMEGIEAYEMEAGVLHIVIESIVTDNFFYHYENRLHDQDVRVQEILSPPVQVPILGNITPTVVIQNVGKNPVSGFNTVCTIDSAGIEIYRDSHVIANISTLESTKQEFSRWSPRGVAEYLLEVVTDLIGDLSHDNDTLRQVIDATTLIDDFDAGTEKWHLGTGWLLSFAGRNFTKGIMTTPRPYSNHTDAAATYLQTFDLSALPEDKTAAMRFWTRYKLETLKDFLLVEASDDGLDWTEAASYSGATDWVQSLVPLDQFAGPGKTSVHFRFRLLTDATGQDEGVSIDDVEMAIVPRTTVAGPAVSPAEIAGQFALSQSYPNPLSVTSSTLDGRHAVVEFALPEPSHVRLQVYDLTGRRVARLIDGSFAPGTHRCNWNGRSSEGRPLASGPYVLRLVATSLHSGQRHILSRTVTLLK